MNEWCGTVINWLNHNNIAKGSAIIQAILENEIE